jgi:serine/threonine protein kinase
MDLNKPTKRDLFINEILVLRTLRHANIVDYIDSFLYKNELWVVMEDMEGGSLTDVITANLMTEGQIAAVGREITQGLQHLHKHGVIHRDIKSSHVLLTLAGEVKLSTYHDGTRDPISDPYLIYNFSWLWFLCARLRSCACKAGDYDRYLVLDGSGDRHMQGLWPESRYMVAWDHSHGYVATIISRIIPVLSLTRRVIQR